MLAHADLGTGGVGQPADQVVLETLAQVLDHYHGHREAFRQAAQYGLEHLGASGGGSDGH